MSEPEALTYPQPAAIDSLPNGAFSAQSGQCAVSARSQLSPQPEVETFYGRCFWPLASKAMKDEDMKDEETWKM